MINPKWQLLLHPVFLLCLVVLLLNDFIWKYEYHNWLTGKLSDFAGLFAFSVFLIAVFPFEKKKILLFSALFFCYWKSPYSDSLIFFLNTISGVAISRVIDYSDLPALLVIPFAYYIKTPRYSLTAIRSLAIYTIAVISFFSFCATSLPRHLIYYPYRENEILFNESYNSRLSEAEVLEKLDPQKRGYLKDSVRYYRVTENEDFYFRMKNRNDSTTMWVPVLNSKDSSLFIKRIHPLFYTIPYYVLNSDTLINLELSIYPSGKRKKKISIRIESFQAKYPSVDRNFYDDNLRRKYKKHFQALFSK
jgi:hypothetical protein